jgi:hypothetical protein
MAKAQVITEAKKILQEAKLTHPEISKFQDANRKSN